MNFYVDHPQVLHDAIVELKKIKQPYYIHTARGRPTEGEELTVWKRVNSFFHRGIVPIYCEFTGLLEPEAKEELQRMFALIEEHENHYLVESISGMSLKRLNGFVEQCQTHLVKQFGIRANDLIEISRKSKIITR